jgi:catechol 2,3-dioxygenase-like lactoylglutathione lyase family enzyme
MESLSPNIFVKDINETIKFYQLLGFSLVVTVPETGPDLVWAHDEQRKCYHDVSDHGKPWRTAARN